MSVFSTAAQRAREAYKAAQQQQHDGNPGGNSLWRFINSVAASFDYMYMHPASDITNALSAFAALVTGNGTAFHNAMDRMVGYMQNNPIAALRSWVIKMIAQLENQIVKNLTFLENLIMTAEDEAYKQMIKHVAAERRWRIHMIHLAERKARQEIKAVHQSIEREAASGYKAATPQQHGILAELADLIANHNPLVRDLVGKLVTGIMDLATVDDPVARVALSFVLSHIIDRLTIDKVIGDLLSRLLQSVLGQGQPQNLHDVIYALATRIGAVEQEWATFMQDGGPEILQAGKEWQGITSLVADAGLLAFFGQAALAPSAWASEVSATLGTVVNDTIMAATKLIREG